jgi:hypothetical protein
MKIADAGAKAAALAVKLAGLLEQLDGSVKRISSNQGTTVAVDQQDRGAHPD